MSKKWKIILIIVVSYIGSNWLIGGIRFLSSQSSSPSSTITASSVDSEQLKITVKAFMKSTLGTLSNGNIDLEMAKEVTSTLEFAKRLSDISAIPIVYGIQQGPDDIVIHEPVIKKNIATVRVDGLYGGDVGQTWIFELVPDSSDIWRINNIIPAK